MNKKEVKDFFDKYALTWDETADLNEDAVKLILDRSGVAEDAKVLDIGCGTGVLFGYYFSRGASAVTGADISPEMVKLAQAKFPQAEVLCMDAEEAEFEQSYDVVMVFNALPHFVSPHKLMERAAGVSCELIEAVKLAELMEQYFHVDTVISDETMYMVSGVKE